MGSAELTCRVRVPRHEAPGDAREEGVPGEESGGDPGLAEAPQGAVEVEAPANAVVRAGVGQDRGDGAATAATAIVPVPERGGVVLSTPQRIRVLPGRRPEDAAR